MFYEKAKPLGGTQLNYKVINNKTEYPIGVKNLFWNFNLATGTATTSNGVSYTLNTNQTITMSGTATAQSYRTFAKRIPLIKGKTYTIKGVGVANNYRIILAAHSESAWVQDIAVSANTNTTFTYTGLPEGATHIQAKVHVYNGTSVNTTISPIMVEGTSVGDFEVYQSTVENLLHIKTDTLITDHYFSYSEPNKSIENFYIFGGATSSSDYTGGWSNGNASSTDASKITCGTDGWIRTVEKIDVTNFDVIKAYLYIQQPYESEIYLALGDSYGYKYTGLQYYILTIPMSSATEGVYKAIEIDVSDITGSYYICLSHRGYGSSYWQYIKATYVTNSSPIGRVWIQTDSDASVGFNAIKKNEIMIYPKKLKQWDSSKWKSLDGTLYKTNNIVKDFKAYLPDDPFVLNYSDQKTATTGGWVLANRGGYAYHQAWRDSDNAWVMRYSGNNWSGAGWMQTKNKINITGYSALRLTGRTQRGYGDADKGDGYVYIALVNNASGSGDNATGYCGGDPNSILPTISSMASQTAVKVTQGYYSNSTINLSLDVSDINGEYYIQIGRYNHSGYDTFSSFFEKLEFVE